MKCCIILGLLFSFSGAVLAADKARGPAATKPTKAIPAANCVTSECHADVKATPVVHGPVAHNHCEGCHEAVDVTKHTFSFIREKAEMCTYCHEFSVADVPVVHKPVKEGECLGCHDPHGGQTHAITREKTTPELCGRCHDDVMKGKSFAHSPIAQGACDSCHTPHAGKFPKLLDVVGTDLCIACHQEVETALTSAKSMHKALEKGCEKCHDAHGSNAPMSLKTTVPDLCIECHEKTQQKIASAAVGHSAVSRDRSCMNCHSAHASNAGKLLAEMPVVGCMKCHDKEVKRSNGTMVSAVPEVADPKLVKHGEIKDGQCSGCHEVHGGANPMLLTKSYSLAFYQNFSADNYAFCFQCHDPRLAQDRKTVKATGFRNGEENLHYVHANVGTRDKNCRVCHVAHAGPNVRVLRTSMKFGKWNMPIAYEKTATGGSCVPGCHAMYSYDRERAQPTTRPITLASARRPVDRSEYEDAKLISWSATDINGAEVAIPDKANRPVVLVLMSGGDAQNMSLVRALRALTPKATAASYVLILGGRNAATDATALSQAALGWPVVLDPNHDAAQAMGAAGWPLVLVLRSDGKEIARLSGGVDFLPVKLDAYLDVASGAEDNNSVQDRLASKPVVVSDAAVRLSRSLRIARMLLDERKPTQAMAYLDREARTGNASPQFQALRAEALLQMKQPDEALAILNRLAPDALPAPSLSLLRCRVLIAQDQWGYAREPLQETVLKFPGSAEAHHLLGQVYEHDGNFARAAEQYRLASEAKDKR